MFDLDLYSNANNSSRSTLLIDLSLCLLSMKSQANVCGVKDNNSNFPFSHREQENIPNIEKYFD